MRELVEWAAFEKLYGPITVQERVDAAGAIAAWASVKAAGATDVEPSEFLPKWDEREKQSQSIGDMIQVMRGLQSRKKKGKRK